MNRTGVFLATVSRMIFHFSHRPGSMMLLYDVLSLTSPVMLQ